LSRAERPTAGSTARAAQKAAVIESEVRMAATQTCVVCGKPMDPKASGNYHIKHRATKAEKHAHADCVQCEPAKAKAEGF
jgi:ketopantoate hydroxymethyltransferase